MLNTILLESALILAVFLAFTVLAPVLLNFARFTGRFLRTCPHLQQNRHILQGLRMLTHYPTRGDLWFGSFAAPLDG